MNFKKTLSDLLRQMPFHNQLKLNKAVTFSCLYFSISSLLMVYCWESIPKIVNNFNHNINFNPKCFYSFYHEFWYCFFYVYRNSAIVTTIFLFFSFLLFHFFFKVEFLFIKRTFIFCIQRIISCSNRLWISTGVFQNVCYYAIFVSYDFTFCNKPEILIRLLLLLSNS